MEHVERGIPQVSAMRMLFPLGAGTALSLMGDATLYAVLPTHPGDAGIALASVGLVLSVNRLIRLITNGPAGWLFDRLPNRRALFVGSLWLGVLSTAVYALVSGLTFLLLGRLLWGLAWSGIWIGGNAIVLETAPADQRGRWVGTYQTWFFFGSTLGSLLGGVLTDAVGYRSGLWLGAGISALGALIAMGVTSGSARERALHIVARSRLAGFRWNSISPAMWADATAHGINRLVVAGVVSATLGLVLQASVGSGLSWGTWQVGIASLTGGMLAARTLVSLLGAPLAGIWSDVAGRRWRLLAASLFVGGVGIGLMVIPNGAILALGLAVGAAASGSIQSVATALVGDLSPPQEHGRNLGLFHTLGDFGSAVGPLVSYTLLPVVGLGLVYFGCAVLMGLTGLWAMVAGRSQRALTPSSAD